MAQARKDVGIINARVGRLCEAQIRELLFFFQSGNPELKISIRDIIRLAVARLKQTMDEGEIINIREELKEEAVFQDSES